ncbi:MAG: hypothetical protein ABSA83_18180 [Verrucomicrobiota bacterium]
MPQTLCCQTLAHSFCQEKTANNQANNSGGNHKLRNQGRVAAKTKRLQQDTPCIITGDKMGHWRGMSTFYFEILNLFFGGKGLDLSGALAHGFEHGRIQCSSDRDPGAARGVEQTALANAP